MSMVVADLRHALARRFAARQHAIAFGRKCQKYRQESGHKSMRRFTVSCGKPTAAFRILQRRKLFASYSGHWLHPGEKVAHLLHAGDILSGDD